MTQAVQQKVRQKFQEARAQLFRVGRREEGGDAEHGDATIGPMAA